MSHRHTMTVYVDCGSTSVCSIEAGVSHQTLLEGEQGVMVLRAVLFGQHLIELFLLDFGAVFRGDGGQLGRLLLDTDGVVKVFERVEGAANGFVLFANALCLGLLLSLGLG